VGRREAHLRVWGRETYQAGVPLLLGVGGVIWASLPASRRRMGLPARL